MSIQFMRATRPRDIQKPLTYLTLLKIAGGLGVKMEELVKE